MRRKSLSTDRAHVLFRGQHATIAQYLSIQQQTSGEARNKLKSRGFRATSLSTYDFSTLYTTLPHNLIKEKFINLIEWTFVLPVTKHRLSSLLETQNDINCGFVKTCVRP